jgi:DNA replication protein DnaC
MERIQMPERFSMVEPSDFDEKAFVQFKVDCENRKAGDLNEHDGYDCPICKNKGVIYKVDEYMGNYKEIATKCKCDTVRRSIMRMKRSGLEDVIKEKTFARFEATETWQKVVKQEAEEYANNPDGWYFIGGQSGCGKTHICTAISREFLLKGMETYYMKWRDDVAKLKGLSLDAEEREEMISKYKNAKVLYIDDLFKTGRNPDGTEPKPTAADINIAFEIINYRYCKPDLLTIISSELSINEILDIDEATGGRICERAKVTNISKDRSRNYRTRNAMTI